MATSLKAPPLTTRELADELHTDPKSLRRFLRAYLPPDQQPGSARGRYHIERKELRRLKRAWMLWH